MAARLTGKGPMSENRANCLTYYMHDEAAAFRLQLAGDLSKDTTADLDQARETASSVFRGRPLIVDFTGIESIDTAGRKLIEKWHGLGAQFVVTTRQAQMRIQSMTGIPFRLLRKNRDRSEWLHGWLLPRAQGWRNGSKSTSTSETQHA